MKRAVSLLALVATASLAQVGAEVVLEVAPQCRATLDKSWRDHFDVRKVHWTGACTLGFAAGPGLLEWEGYDSKWDVRTRGVAQLRLAGTERIPLVPTANHEHAIHLRHGRDRFSSLRYSQQGTQAATARFIPVDDLPDWAQFAASGVFSPARVDAGLLSEPPAVPAKSEFEVARQEVSTPSREPPRPLAAGVRGRATALVVGNGRYASLGQLPNPPNDAAAIAAKFRAMGFDVELLVDASRDDLMAALKRQAVRTEADELSVFYYAGHGVQVEGTNYLIPVNMRADNVGAGTVKAGAVSLNSVLAHFASRTRIVFLDACRDNPMARIVADADPQGTTATAPGTQVAARTRGFGGAPGLAPVSATRGTLIAYATRDGSTAEDGEGRHSPYTTALLEHLGNPIDIGLVLRRVRQAVMRATQNRQEPWEYGSLVGDELVLAKAAQ